MTRWKASGIHLLLSVLVASAVTVFIRFILYPDFYFYLSGGLKLLFLIVGVDVVMGPLLTMVVFKPGKKSLKFDLSVIAILQIAALGYGFHTMWVARPVYNVFAIDRFVAVSAAKLDPVALSKAKPEYQVLPWFGPKLVAVQKPTDLKELFSLIESGLAGADIEVHPKYYVPFESKKQEVIARSKPLGELKKSHGNMVLLEAFLRKYGGSEEDYAYLPMQGFSENAMTAIIRKTDALPVTAIPIDPWTLKSE